MRRHVPTILTGVSPRIAVELSQSELDSLDLAVSQGAFESREAAVQSALRTVLRRPGDEDIAEAYKQAYGGVPEDEKWGTAGLRLAAESVRGRRR
jgi:Arc/MetJ-type ribon-helix-helix transcriptional regulator